MSLKTKKNSGKLVEFQNWIDRNKVQSICQKDFYSSPRISSEYPDCSMPNTFDQYNFCGNACSYCFAYTQKVNNPAVTKSKTGLLLKQTNFKKFKKEFEGRKETDRYKYFYKKRKVLQWGSMADPFDAVFEAKYHVGEDYIKLFSEHNYPVRFCSKFYPTRRLIDLFEEAKKKKNYAFMYSIITTDEADAKRIEYGAPPPKRRFEALKLFSDMGYYTMLRMRPFVMGTSDKTLDDLLAKGLEANVDSVSVEWYCIDVRASPHVKAMQNWLSDTVGFDIVKYAKAITPKKRGGYLRLSRDVKEPYIRKIYQWCLENDVLFACSDPDFKELNMSGSCCGLPELDRNKYHPDLSNFIRSQWTSFLRNARINFWKKNTVEDVLKNDFEDELITFSQVKDNPDSKWMNSKEFTNDSVEVTGMNKSERMNSTLMLFMRKRWNKCKEVNYFDGKILPLKYDEEDNVVYKYVPHPYEITWQRDYGIDLSK